MRIQGRLFRFKMASFGKTTRRVFGKVETMNRYGETKPDVNDRPPALPDVAKLATRIGQVAQLPKFEPLAKFLQSLGVDPKSADASALPALPDLQALVCRISADSNGFVRLTIETHHA
jgi:hypothetical protein